MAANAASGVQRRRKRGAMIGAIAAAIGLCAVAAFAFGGSARTSSTISPDGTYRLEWITPNRLDRMLHSDMVTPARIRLYNNLTGRLVATSDVVDLDAGENGRPIWMMKDMGVVSVGTGVQFLHVPPLAADGHALPIDKAFDGNTP